MVKYIIIEADTNDGDYITERSVITDEQIKLILPIIEEIEKNNGQYGKGEVGYDFDAEENYGHLENFELFDEFAPYGEYGIHTIESIEILEVINETKLL
jgi:hypothetical protein